MQIYIVTSKATEKDSDGNVLEAKVRLYGAFTSDAFAEGIRAKYNGSVTEITVDKEYAPIDGLVLGRWLNPGIADS